MLVYHIQTIHPGICVFIILPFVQNAPAKKVLSKANIFSSFSIFVKKSYTNPSIPDIVCHKGHPSPVSFVIFTRKYYFLGFKVHIVLTYIPEGI